MCTWRQVPFSTCWGRRVQKDLLLFWRSLYNWVVYLKILTRESPFYGNLEYQDRNTPSKIFKSNWHHVKIRGRKGPSRGIIQKCAPHERGPCAPKFGERSHAPRKMRPQSSVGFGEQYLQAQEFGYNYVLFNETRGARVVVDSGASMHMMSKKELCSGEMDRKKVQNPNCSVDCKRRSAHPRGGTSVHSWLESVRDRAITRWNACSPIARQALRRPRILLWVGQQSKATIDQRREEKNCKTDNFVLLVVPGLSTNPESGSSPTSPSQDSLRREAEQASRELVRRASSSSSSSVLERSDELASKGLVQSPEIQNQNKKRDDKKISDDPLADLPYWLQDFIENLKVTEMPAPAHSSRESDSERVFIFTFQQTEIATYARESK